MRKLSVNVDVIASKIKKGSGEHVCEVLIGLIDATLKKKRIILNNPVFPKQYPPLYKIEMTTPKCRRTLEETMMTQLR